MEWYFWLGGLILTAQLLKQQPSLGRVGLGERLENTLDFTINLLAEDVVTITELDAPQEISAGGVPTVKVTVNHNSEAWEWVFARIRDRDTGAVVAPMISHYMVGLGSWTFQFVGGLYPIGAWNVAMPNRDWNLVVEVGVTWV